MAWRSGAVLPLALVVLAAVPTWAAQAAPGPGAATTAGRPAAPSASGASPPNRSEALAPPQVSQDAAARTRMHECGHQWSSLKKSGNTGTLTWKEFSATCLAYNR